MSSIRESDLPGIGKKFEMHSNERDKIAVIIHDNGQREVYVFPEGCDPDTPTVVSLSDTEARQIAGIIGGMAYKPKDLEAVEIALDDLVIEWYKVDDNSPEIGKTIGALGIRQTTGVTVAAVNAPDGTTTISPGPEQHIDGGATLIIIGERLNIRKFRDLMAGTL